MIAHVLYFISTLLALGFLIFIHELGHYFMGRRVGMRVEVFSIGFGKPFLVWKRGDVVWQICTIPFGGYVRFAGEDLENNQEPYDVPGGFLAASPWDRIKVSFMGPLVNLLFALLVFTVIWFSGGREKRFQDVSPMIGWVDPASEIYEKGLRPGDEMIKYDDRAYKNQRDHLQAGTASDGTVMVSALQHDYKRGTREEFEQLIEAYPHPLARDSGILTLGVLQAANFLIYDRLPGAYENLIHEKAPMFNSGIRYGDRIVWLDGELIFSLEQFKTLLNDNKFLLTVKRGDEHLLLRIPRVKVKELKLNSYQQDEMEDWQFESSIQSSFPEMYAIAYDLRLDCTVQDKIPFIDQDDEKKVEKNFPEQENKLLAGDVIVAVNGKAVKKAYELLSLLQEKKVQMIVQRDAGVQEGLLLETANERFRQGYDYEAIQTIVSSIGSSKGQKKLGSFELLEGVTPVRQKELPMNADRRDAMDRMNKQYKKNLEAIQDIEKRNHALQLWEEEQNQLLLGISLQDQIVQYNPGPFELFSTVFNDIFYTLSALVGGYLHPKFLSGPIGIVQLIHYYSWTVGLKEALFWLAVISLNLGVINLLPIPVLDGGYIFLSIFEMITKVRLKAKTMERLVFPFFVLLIALIIFVTFQDLQRLLQFISI